MAGMYLLDCIMYVKMVAIDGRGKGAWILQVAILLCRKWAMASASSTAQFRVPEVNALNQNLVPSRCLFRYASRFC